MNEGIMTDTNRATCRKVWLSGNPALSLAFDVLWSFNGQRLPHFGVLGVPWLGPASCTVTNIVGLEVCDKSIDLPVVKALCFRLYIYMGDRQNFGIGDTLPSHAVVKHEEETTYIYKQNCETVHEVKALCAAQFSLNTGLSYIRYDKKKSYLQSQQCEYEMYSDIWSYVQDENQCQLRDR